jgi:hypothetical protein
MVPVSVRFESVRCAALVSWVDRKPRTASQRTASTRTVDDRCLKLGSTSPSVVAQPLAHPVARSSVSRSCALAITLVPALGAWGLERGAGPGPGLSKIRVVLPITLDPDIDDIDLDNWTPPTPPAIQAQRQPWDMLTMAICDHCRQPVGLPRLITIGSTKDPSYRARVDPSCLKVPNSEGLTDLVPVSTL